jgi:hypothetical protein
LRATYGVNGNISRLTSAYTTANFYFTGATTSAPAAVIVNPPNERLRWEQVRIVNIGLDFETKNKILSGSIEYYKKNGKDLMGKAPVDPTLGLYDGSGSFFYGNVAGMKGSGFDVQVNSRNIDGKFKWYSNLIFSQTTSKVSKYLMPVASTGYTYLPISPNFISPVIGKPLFAVYSFKWQGLDNTGNPVGYFNGQSSTDYAAIYSQTKLDSMVYNGPVQPTVFGALRNTFQWNNFSLSINVSYKFGYYFRRSSVNYYDLISSWNGSGDYAKRWQKPGDEKITNVPSFVYPVDLNRESFYQYSENLVIKGDNIRLEDINLSYDLTKSLWKRLPFSQVRLYIYAANFGTIWKANKEGIDPYYNNIPSAGKSITLGANINF